ncbi:MAG: substrate-binding periplasmic protein [Planctomycetota bacterium]|jgi:polar amino acid transport system substrate-binding protein
MKNWYFIVAAAVILVGLLALVYSPFLFPPERKTNGNGLFGDTGDGEPTDRHVLTFASDPWPPYAGTAGAEQEGYIVDVLRAIFEPLGYEVGYVNKPWTRCIDEVRHGNLTGLAGCDVHEAPDLVYPRETVGTTRPTFFVREGANWRYDGVDSLTSIRLGAIQDYTYERDVDVYIRQQQGTARVLLTRGNDALVRLIQALRAGAIDAFIENGPVAMTVMASLGDQAKGIVPAGEAPGLCLYVPFSPGIPGGRPYAQMFDREIVELRESGRLAEILGAYGLEDWHDHELRLRKNDAGDE